MKTNEIEVRRNGPLICRGDIQVIDADGNLIDRSDDIALCRCGLSANKPYCDGTHKREGFEADGMVEDLRGEPLAAPGPLRLTLRRNAMVIASGPMRMFGSEVGETTRNKAALCRCGQSENKPFCDAAHRRCGFQAG